MGEDFHDFQFEDLAALTEGLFSTREFFGGGQFPYWYSSSDAAAVGQRSYVFAFQMSNLGMCSFSQTRYVELRYGGGICAVA